MTLEAGGKVLTADEARKVAKGILGAVKKGSDPALERDKKRKEKTIADPDQFHLCRLDGGQVSRPLPF